MVFVASIVRNKLCIIYAFFDYFFSKIIFYRKLFPDCYDKFDYLGSLYTRLIFYQRSDFIRYDNTNIRKIISSLLCDIGHILCARVCFDWEMANKARFYFYLTESLLSIFDVQGYFLWYSLFAIISTEFLVFSLTVFQG